MKVLLTILTSTLITISLFSQSKGKITYIETIKLDLHIQGLDESMLKLLPKSKSLEKELVFNNTISIYRDTDNPEEDSSIDKEGVVIKFLQEDTKDILYKNQNEKIKIHQKGFMGKSFIIKEKIKIYKWKLTGEKIKYLNYECQKAVIQTDDEFIVAWFAPQIPVPHGPSIYHGLPGAILLVSINDGETEIKAQKIELSTLTETLNIPTDGKVVTEKELEKIELEKMKEMEEMYRHR